MDPLNWLMFPCQECGAKPQELCIGKKGQKQDKPHRERAKEARSVRLMVAGK